jgi:hypothetical protein
MSTEQIVAALEKMGHDELSQFVDELQRHHELAEDLHDLLAFQLRGDEPVRPFEDFLRDLKRPA